MLVAFIERRWRGVLALAILAATAGSIAIAASERDDRLDDRCDHCGVVVAQDYEPGPPWLAGARWHRIAGQFHGHTRGLRIALRAVAGGGAAWHGMETTIGADGLFDFGPRPAGEYELIAMRDGVPFSDVALVRTDREAFNEWQDGDDVELVQWSCRPREVLVTDTDEAPIAGANIFVGGVRAWTTDTHGIAETCLVLDDPVEVIVRAGGHATGHAFLFADTETRLHVRLQPAVDASGAIVDRDGTPIAGALVELSAVHSGPDVVDAAVTGDDGSFTLSLARDSGPYRVTVRRGSTRWDAGTISASETGARLVIHGPGIAEPSVPRLERVIRGRVTCDHRPQPFVRIERGDDVTHSRADGSFVLVIRDAHAYPPWLRAGPALAAEDVVTFPALDELGERVELITCR